jgi:hypothetical protein
MNRSVLNLCSSLFWYDSLNCYQPIKSMNLKHMFYLTCILDFDQILLL